MAAIGKRCLGRSGKTRGSAARATRACHASGLSGMLRHKPIYDGLDISKVTALYSAASNWDLVKRLKDTTSMKLILKGIVTRDDAALAVQNGVDGVIVSN